MMRLALVLLLLVSVCCAGKAGKKTKKKTKALAKTEAKPQNQPSISDDEEALQTIFEDVTEAQITSAKQQSIPSAGKATKKKKKVKKGKKKTPVKQPTPETTSSSKKDVQKLKKDMTALTKTVNTQKEKIKELKVGFLDVYSRTETQDQIMTSQQTELQNQEIIIKELKAKLSDLEIWTHDKFQEQRIQESTLLDLVGRVEDIQGQLTAIQYKCEEQGEKALIRETDIRTVQAENNQLKSNISNLHTQANIGTALLTVWGRTICPVNFTEVYTGYTGGSLSSKSGGAAAYKCMPLVIAWGQHANKSMPNSAGTYFYPTRYQAPTGLWQGLRHMQVPCTICLGQQHKTIVMIMGKLTCPNQWTIVYVGYVVSGKDAHMGSSEFQCLHHMPQGIGNATEKPGKPFFAVRTRCGSFPCPPYEPSKIMSCVVCAR